LNFAVGTHGHGACDLCKDGLGWAVQLEWASLIGL